MPHLKSGSRLALDPFHLWGDLWTNGWNTLIHTHQPAALNLTARKLLPSGHPVTETVHYVRFSEAKRWPLPSESFTWDWTTLKSRLFALVGSTRDLLYKTIIQSSIHAACSSRVLWWVAQPGFRLKVAVCLLGTLLWAAISYLSRPVAGHTDSKAVIWKLKTSRYLLD